MPHTGSKIETSASLLWLDDLAAAMDTRELVAKVAVSREHHVGAARRVARLLARETGFSSTAVCCVETSASELAANLHLHASRGGALSFFRLVASKDGTGVNATRTEGGRGLLGPRSSVLGVEVAGLEIASEDDGPGIADVERAMRDGYSTNGGLGGGLPGVRRLMDEFFIFSRRSGPTLVVARKWLKCK